MNSTFKTTFLSIGLHVLFLAIGSTLLFKSSLDSLELTGASGKRQIALTGFNFGAGREIKEKTISRPTKTTTLTSATKGNSSNFLSQATSSGIGPASTQVGIAAAAGSTSGASGSDADNGLLFSEIKNYFEKRLGSTLNIRENQLIKIKFTIEADGSVSEASLLSGSLEASIMRKLLSVAKSLPLKNFWKGDNFPRELIVPIALTADL